MQLDALHLKVREAGRIVSVACVHAVGVNSDGVRESLGLDLATSEGGAGWTAFLRSLVARGLSGVAPVTSDAHPGLVDAITATLPGASRQRCRTHFMRNLLCRVPRSAQPLVATLVRSTFAPPDAVSVREQHVRVTAFPREVWRQVWSSNPLERLNREIQRRSDVVGIFPDRAAVLRLVGAVLAEQNDEWADAGRRCISLDAIARTLAPQDPEQAVEVAMIAA